MQTILYQGRPVEGGAWMTLPDHCVATYIALAYQTRELVLRADADKALTALRIAGAKMSNALYNLAQDNGLVTDADLRANLRKMQREWDAAVESVSGEAS
jgi:hypothetical protein